MAFDALEQYKRILNSLNELEAACGEVMNEAQKADLKSQQEDLISKIEALENPPVEEEPSAAEEVIEE